MTKIIEDVSQPVMTRDIITSQLATQSMMALMVNYETSGVFGPKTMEFLKGLGHRLRQVSGEANSFAYLTQRLSVAVQRGNAASVLGTMKMGSQEEEFFV